VAIELTCSCGKKLKVSEEFAGRTGVCPGCGSAVAIPGHAMSPPAVPFAEPQRAIMPPPLPQAAPPPVSHYLSLRSFPRVTPFATVFISTCHPDL